MLSEAEVNSIRIGNTSGFPAYVSGGMVTEKKARGSVLVESVGERNEEIMFIHIYVYIYMYICIYMYIVYIILFHSCYLQVGVPYPFKSLAETLKDSIGCRYQDIDGCNTLLWL